MYLAGGSQELIDFGQACSAQSDQVDGCGAFMESQDTLCETRQGCQNQPDVLPSPYIIIRDYGIMPSRYAKNNFFCR